MTVKFVQSGKSIDYTPGADVAAGTVVVQGDLVGVAKLDIKASTLGALAVEGVFDVAKDNTTGPVFVVGDEVYYDLVNELAVHAPGGAGGIYLGLCIKGAGTSDATVRVRVESTPTIHDRLYEAVTVAGGSKTLDAEDVGKLLNVTGHATNVVTLPATAAGLDYFVRAAGDGVRLAISPNANDKIMGANLAGADDKDRILAAATAKAGDYIHLIGDGAGGWFVVAERGLWTAEG